MCWSRLGIGTWDDHIWPSREEKNEIKQSRKGEDSVGEKGRLIRCCPPVKLDPPDDRIWEDVQDVDRRVAVQRLANVSMRKFDVQ